MTFAWIGQCCFIYVQGAEQEQVDDRALPSGRGRRGGCGAERRAAGVGPLRPLSLAGRARGRRDLHDGCRGGALEAEHKGRLAELDGSALADVVERYERIEEQLGKVASYAQLLHAARTDDPEIGRFFQTVQERVNETGTRLLFITLEINRIEEDALAAKLAQSPALARYRPWLRDVRAFRPHQLDDEIERVLHEKSVAGRSAWIRLFDETMAGLRFPLDGKELTSAEIFDLLSDKDRARRAAAGRSIAGVLARQPACSP